jgi:protein-disulfide isomerase
MRTIGNRILIICATLTAVGAVVAAQGGKQKLELSFCGVPAAPVRIEIFSDFQCPHCRIFYFEIVKPLIKDYAAGRQVYVVYHDFPLDMHPYGRTAARLALAAMRLGRNQWLRVTDTLYATQDQWAQDGKLDGILAKVLSPTELARVKLLAADSNTDEALRQEIMLGNSRGITSTPTYFITTQTGKEQRIAQVLSYPVIKDYVSRFLK